MLSLHKQGLLPALALSSAYPCTQSFLEEVRDITDPCDVCGVQNLRDSPTNFTDGATEAQRGEGTYSKSHSK